MERRRFLQLLGLAPVAAVTAPKISYSFLGGILRPRIQYPKTAIYNANIWQWTFAISHFEKLNPHITGPLAVRLITEMKQHNDRVYAEMAAQDWRPVVLDLPITRSPIT
jgi:hypothetical protein